MSVVASGPDMASLPMRRVRPAPDHPERSRGRVGGVRDGDPGSGPGTARAAGVRGVLHRANTREAIPLLEVGLVLRLTHRMYASSPESSCRTSSSHSRGISSAARASASLRSGRTRSLACPETRFDGRQRSVGSRCPPRPSARGGATEPKTRNGRSRRRPRARRPHPDLRSRRTPSPVRISTASLGGSSRAVT
jgi:hypothetical protein